MTEVYLPLAFGDISYCTLQWSHSIWHDPDFVSPWQAHEQAIDLSISALGFDACSRLLDGSSGHDDLLVRDAPKIQDYM